MMQRKIVAINEDAGQSVFNILKSQLEEISEQINHPNKGTDITHLAGQQLLLQEQLTLWARLIGRTDFHPLAKERDMISDLINSGYMGVITEIGAGVGLAAKLLAYGGASSYIFGTSSPYNQTFRDTYFLQKKAEAGSVSAKTAYEIALASFNYANHQLEKKPFGLAITAATSTTHARRGANHAYIHFMGKNLTDVGIHCVLNHSDRDIQQLTVAKLGFLVAHQMITQGRFSISDIATELKYLTYIDEIRYSARNDFLSQISSNLELIENKLTPHIFFTPTKNLGQMEIADFKQALREKKAIALYRGSFNPVTNGHVQIMQKSINTITQLKGLTKVDLLPVFEITIANADKKLGTLGEIAHRVQMIGLLGFPVLVTDKKFNYELSESLGKVTELPLQYVMGYDTFERLYQEKYYKDYPGGLHAALSVLLGKENLLFVADRQDKSKALMNFSSNKDYPGSDQLNGRTHRLVIQVDCSSSDVREKIANGQVPDNIDPQIWEYIKKKELYGYQKQK